jgi:hypothetical protein
VLNRYGQTQAGLLSAVDSLGFGLPSAVLSRFAPQTEAELKSVRDAYRNTSIGASLGAYLLNPFNSVLRAAGDALGRRGAGLATQGAADAATVAGVMAAPGLVRDGALDMNAHVGLTHMAPAAMMSRAFMPQLPASIVERAYKGSLAGTASHLPYAASGDFMNIPIGAATGVALATGQRPRSPAPAAKVDPDELAAKLTAQAGVLGFIPSAAIVLGSGKPDRQLPKSPDDSFARFLFGEMTNPIKYPPPNPFATTDAESQPDGFYGGGAPTLAQMLRNGAP